MARKTIRITARISEQAHSILTREARKLIRTATSRLPYGEVLDALIVDIGGTDEDWEELRDIVLWEREKRDTARLEKDRDRKRAKEKPIQ